MLAMHSQNFILPFSLPWCQQDSHPWPLDDGARVLPLVNHYLPRIHKTSFCHFLFHGASRTQTLTVGWWGESSTTSKPLLASYSQNFFLPLNHNFFRIYRRRHYTQHSDIQQNDIQDNNNIKRDTEHISLRILALLLCWVSQIRSLWWVSRRLLGRMLQTLLEKL